MSSRQEHSKLASTILKPPLAGDGCRGKTSVRHGGEKDAFFAEREDGVKAQHIDKGVDMNTVRANTFDHYNIGTN